MKGFLPKRMGYQQGGGRKGHEEKRRTCQDELEGKKTKGG